VGGGLPVLLISGALFPNAGGDLFFAGMLALPRLLASALLIHC